MKSSNCIHNLNDGIIKYQSLDFLFLIQTSLGGQVIGMVSIHELNLIQLSFTGQCLSAVGVGMVLVRGRSLRGRSICTQQDGQIIWIGRLNGLSGTAQKLVKVVITYVCYLNSRLVTAKEKQKDL